MKRIAFSVGLIVLAFAISIWAQTAASKPYPELNKFDVFVGHWTYEVDYLAGLLGPSSKITGEQTIKRILGGFFFENQWTEKEAAEESQGIEIIGLDRVNENFFSKEYHDDGSMSSGAYEFDGNTCIYTGKFVVEGKLYMFKITDIFAKDLMSFTSKGKISADGNPWVPWIEGKYTKAGLTPKKPPMAGGTR